MTRVVCVGGGHCNVQVLKQLKKTLPNSAQLTLINESPVSFYSGMLPGAVSQLYKPEDIQIQLQPLAAWCNAHYIEKRVKRIIAAENKVELEDGSTVEYDWLVLNVGSRTRGSHSVEGIWEHSLTTRPINYLLHNLEAKERYLLENKITPSVVVCGSGAAGTELAFGYKKRWERLFNADIQVKIVSNRATVLDGVHPSTIHQITRKLKEHKIEVIPNEVVLRIEADGVVFKSGRKEPCNVAVWATGAEPQQVNCDSDLELLKGYFRVNDFLQSTSHPNVFAGGDCITMQSYAEEANFPPKAGVYAVREGPFIADNIVASIMKTPLKEYVPQRQFLSLMMTGDGSSVGSKFGITFCGRWVWEMKDFIDRGFMKLFDPRYLFNDYDHKGTQEPLNNNELFDDESSKLESEIGHLRLKVKTMSAEEAAHLLSCPESETDFHERFIILQRMHFEKDFEQQVVHHYKPPYY